MEFNQGYQNKMQIKNATFSILCILSLIICIKVYRKLLTCIDFQMVCLICYLIMHGRRKENLTACDTCWDRCVLMSFFFLFHFFIHTRQIPNPKNEELEVKAASRLAVTERYTTLLNSHFANSLQGKRREFLTLLE